MTLKTIHVIASAYQRFGELRVFVQSFINQTKNNWLLTVIHDGPNQEFNFIMSEFVKNFPKKINFHNTDVRANDYGHSLRDLGLKAIKGDYVLLTNADNYYVIKYIEFLNEVILINDPDVITYDMVHSHKNPGIYSKWNYLLNRLSFFNFKNLINRPSYNYFKTSYKRDKIDIGAAIIKTHLIKELDFRDKTFSGDATYFEDIAKIKPSLKIIKIPRVLFVHN
jgi:hypothetical protein